LHKQHTTFILLKTANTMSNVNLKRPRREADHTPTSNAEVKNEWNYISTPPLHLHDKGLSYA